MPVARPAASQSPTSARLQIGEEAERNEREQRFDTGPAAATSAIPVRIGTEARNLEGVTGVGRAQPMKPKPSGENDVERRDEQAADRIDVGHRRERQAALSRRGVVAESVRDPCVGALVNRSAKAPSPADRARGAHENREAAGPARRAA